MFLFLFYPVRRQVIVNTKTDRAFRGVLWRRGWRQLVLKNAEMLRERGDAVSMDGAVVIERGNVDFIQVVS